MRIRFGLEFDEAVYDGTGRRSGQYRFGPNGLMDTLERYSGTQGPSTENGSLRIEQYRQAIKDTLQHQPAAFYLSSFEADELATAATLLRMRDELILAGMHFGFLGKNPPPRLQALADIEEKAGERLIAGLADRYHLLMEALPDARLPFSHILVNDPKHLLPAYITQILSVLAGKGIQIEYQDFFIKNKGTDLCRFRDRLLRPESSPEGQLPLQADGSIIILRSKRETEAGEFLAKLFKRNPDYHPLCLIPEKNRALDNAVIQEGVPSLGILSASLGRPSLQILKLVTAFLWEPIDPYKILEFLSLSLKPLDEKLSLILGRLMAEYPGINSDQWHASINEYFDKVKEREALDRSVSLRDIREQYNFWFNRKRYEVDKTMPVVEAIFVFKYIHDWAKTEYENLGSKNSSLLVLKEQAKKISELLEELPETENDIGYLKLERIVRTVYEPAPVVFRETEVGHFPFIYHNSAIADGVEDLLWWNFTDHDRDYFFSKWYPNELDYFKKMNWEISTPSALNQLALWQRNCPVERCGKRMLLVIPEKVSGVNVQPHSLEGDLKAAFGDLDGISYHIETKKGADFLQTHFNIPGREEVERKQLGMPKAFVNITLSDHLTRQDDGDYETFTSLDSLFYYPYKWLFKYKIELHKSSILSVVKDPALMGNLAHRFFEQMFKEDVCSWTRNDVEKWLDDRSNFMLRREGAVLLMYGKEPEKVAFMQKVKSAAWSLVNMIQTNDWEVLRTEMPLQGKFLGKPVKGKADLVLRRGDELAVVDLKWGGKVRRHTMIRNEEDLQLVMYSKLLTADDSWAHTSYFIMSTSEMLSRNNMGFKEAVAVAPDFDHITTNERIWKKMERTYLWRMEQFRKGKIEIRTRATLEELNELYINELMDILEMKDDNAPYDDYSTLVNLVE